MPQYAEIDIPTNSNMVRFRMTKWDQLVKSFQSLKRKKGAGCATKSGNSGQPGTDRGTAAHTLSSFFGAGAGLGAAAGAGLGSTFDSGVTNDGKWDK